MLISGRNVISESIKHNSLLKVRKIFISDKYLDKNLNLVKEIEKRNIEKEILKSSNFERSYGFEKRNQGLVALIDYEYFPFRNLLKNSYFKKVIVLDSIEDPHNFGSIIRTSLGFEADCIVISNKNQSPVNSTVIKVSSGAAAYIPICKVESLEESINSLKMIDYVIISTVAKDGKNLFSLRETIFNKIAIVFGNENRGIRKSILKKSDILISIPISKKVDSLNVSVSCGSILSNLK